MNTVGHALAKAKHPVHVEGIWLLLSHFRYARRRAVAVNIDGDRVEPVETVNDLQAKNGCWDEML